MKRFLLFLLFFALFMGYNNLLSAQEKIIEFGYDESGNRITRQVIELKMKNSSPVDTTVDNSDQQGEIYTEIIDNHNVAVFPNPTKGQFKVVINDYQNDMDASIYLHSVGGILIFSDENARAETHIDIGKSENGAYILTVTISGKSRTWKIIKN